MRLFSMIFAWIFGWGESSESSKPEIAPSYLTTDSAGSDTGGEEEPLDTAEDTDTGSTSETGETGASETGETGDTSVTADTALKSAVELSGENGGFGCATVSADAAVSIWLGVLALGLRRRD